MIRSAATLGPKISDTSGQLSSRKANPKANSNSADASWAPRSEPLHSTQTPLGHSSRSGGVIAQGLRSSAVSSGRHELGRLPLIVASVLVIAISFWMGIAIGRSVFGRHARQPESSRITSRSFSTALPSTSGTPAPLAPTTSYPAPVSDSNATVSRATSAATTEAGASPPTNIPTRNAATQPEPGGNTLEPLPAGNSLASSEVLSKAGSGGGAGGPRKGSASENSSVIPGAGKSELIVTPNEGDTPLRIDLPEEIIVQSASLEIRSRRSAEVPGVPARRSHKIRKERLVIGPMISRVTPQPPAAALGTEQTVIVRATIDGDGHVSYVDPVSGPMALVPSVMSAVREWKFEPTSLDGEPLETEADLTIKFRPLH